MAEDITSFIGKLNSLESQGQPQTNKNVVGGQRERIVYEATIFWETYHKLKHRWTKDEKPDTLIKEKAKGKDCCKSLISKVTKEAKPVKVLERGKEKEGLSTAAKLAVGTIVAGALATAGVKALLAPWVQMGEQFNKFLKDLKETPDAPTQLPGKQKGKKTGDARPGTISRWIKSWTDLLPKAQGTGGLIPEKTGTSLYEPTKKVTGMPHSNMLQGTEQAVGVSNRYLAEISAGIRNMAKGTGNGAGPGGNMAAGTAPVLPPPAGNTYQDDSGGVGGVPSSQMSSRGSYFDSPNSLNVPGIMA